MGKDVPNLCRSFGGDVLTPADAYIKGMKTELPKWQHWAKEAKRKLDEQLQLQALPSAA